MNADNPPLEYDVVRLLRPLPEHDLLAGATGTVLMDYGKYSQGRPAISKVQRG